MADTDRDLLLGRLAVHFKLLSKERLVEALNHHRRATSTLDFGTFLVAEDYLEPGMLGKLSKARDEYERRQQGSSPPAEKAETPPAQAAPSIPAPSVPESSQSAPTVPARAPEPTAPVPEPASKLPSSAAAPAVEHTTVEPANESPALSTLPKPEDEAPLELVMDSPAPGLELERSSGLLAYQPGVALDALLANAVRLGASDLHVHSGAPLKLRRDGRLEDAGTTMIDGEEAERLIAQVLSPEQLDQLAERHQVDFAYSLPGVGRFRANAYRQQRGVDAVFRAIPPTPPSLEDLGLPPILETMTHQQQGLVLLTGPAGCGKSSTMAAMIELINRNRSDHILTVEDPIEQVFESKSCLVNQRQVGPHTRSFARALRAALREDPDVIVIGELRDLETISLALTAAETGHLVLGTLHTSSAMRTINRLLGVFPSNQQAQVRTMVSESLRAIVSQRLLPKAEGDGRVPVCEILINNHAIGNLIRENKTHQIRSVMQTNAGAGMCLLDAALADLVRARTIKSTDAREHAEEPEKIP